MATLTTLVSFDSTDGASPDTSVIADNAGDLFGTTQFGGADNEGTVFELVNGVGNYMLTTLYTFDGANGFYPEAGVIADPAGDLFGTTAGGGANGAGTIFELANSGAGNYTPTTLVDFDGADGDDPYSGLIADNTGDLFGATTTGGAFGEGSVFELANTDDGFASAPTTLFSFNGANGQGPSGSLLTDAAGDVFGTTSSLGPDGDGTVFELVNTGGGNYTLNTLVTFGGADGAVPSGSLVSDSAGDLFGTTYQGGAFNDGTVFELVNTGGGNYTLNTLITFGGADGYNPDAGLIIDAAGNLFGTTQGGGANSDGTVFEITKTADGYASTPTILASFDVTNGAHPSSGLIADDTGDLFGTTQGGGTNSDGTVFELTDTGFQVPCYCRGTLILTDRGEVPVEGLKIGDLVVTLAGGTKPIKWIGRRGYAGRFVAGNRDVLPIRIAAGALTDNVPSRDLWVSPEHALFIDNLLVPARLLVNGLSVAQADAVERVEYFHIEFEEHEVILAEGTPAESYVDCDNRSSFHNARDFAALYPADERPSFHYHARRLEPDMPELAAIRKTLFDRLEALGLRVTDDPDLHLIVDSEIVLPQCVDDDGCRYTFLLERKPKAVRLASRKAIPAELELLSSDQRQLGICIRQIVLHDEYLRSEVSHAHPSLDEGFHADEGGHRWTDGMALLPQALLSPFTGRLIVEVHRHQAALRYPLRPVAARKEPGPNEARPPAQAA